MTEGQWSENKALTWNSGIFFLPVTELLRDETKVLKLIFLGGLQWYIPLGGKLRWAGAVLCTSALCSTSPEDWASGICRSAHRGFLSRFRSEFNAPSKGRSEDGHHVYSLKIYILSQQCIKCLLSPELRWGLGRMRKWWVINFSLTFERCWWE